MLCLTLNDLSKEGKFSLEKKSLKTSGFLQTALIEGFVWKLKLSAEEKICKDLSKVPFLPCLEKQERNNMRSLKRWGWMCVSSWAPGISVPLRPLWAVGQIKAWERVGEKRLDYSLNAWMVQNWRNKLMSVLTECWSVFSDYARYLDFRKVFHFIFVLFCHWILSFFSADSNSQETEPGVFRSEN